MKSRCGRASTVSLVELSSYINAWEPREPNFRVFTESRLCSNNNPLVYFKNKGNVYHARIFVNSRWREVFFETTDQVECLNAVSDPYLYIIKCAMVMENSSANNFLASAISDIRGNKSKK